MNKRPSEYTLAPLSERVTGNDIRTYKKAIKGTSSTKAFAPEYASIALLGSITVLTWAVVLFVGIVRDFALTTPVIVIASIWTVLTLLCLPPLRKRYTSSVRLMKFAEANGLQYSTLADGPNYEGVIFGLGRNPKREDLIVAPDNAFEMGRYTYIVGTGKFTRLNKWDYIRIPLEHPFAHMVLQANKVGVSGGALTMLPVAFDKEQALPLEEEASKYLSLYAPAQAKQDALTIFTPELVALFANNSKSLNAEIIDDQLFVYSKQQRPDDEQYIQRALTIIEYVTSKLKVTPSSINSQAGATLNTTAESGQRLQRTLPLKQVIIVSLLPLLIVAWIVFVLVNKT